MKGIVDRLDEKIEANSLLQHPFYQAWQRGELTLDDLRRYAEQYYFFEARLPRFLSGIHTMCPFKEVRQVILENLWDEEHGEENHASLWVDFSKSLGLSAEDLTSSNTYPETEHLIAVYLELCSIGSPLFDIGLAAIYVYEKQVPEIARVKMEGLRKFYGITDGKALKFFAVHSELDKEHSLREAEALERYAVHESVISALVGLAADGALSAWWNFLDGIEVRRVKN